MHVAQACLENVSPSKFWSLVGLHPDLVSCLHIQVRVMGNLRVNGGIPWLFNTQGSVLYAKKTQKRYTTTLLSVFPFRDNYSSLWSNLKTTTDVRQPWTNPQDCYFEYLIIRFDYLIIRFDYLIIE